MKREVLSVIVVVLFFGLALAPSINAVENKSHTALGNDGNLSGYVYDININPIEGALVRVYFHGESEEDYTDSSGYYHVTNIPICNCSKNATASKEGYFTEQVLLSIYENTTYDFILTSIDPVPDLDCEGDLAFSDVEPGSTLTGTITVENVGEPDSELSWEIESFPDWGMWTFDPESGVNLLSGYTVDIAVEIGVPEEPGVEFSGDVKLVNSDNTSDFCTVSVSLPYDYNDYTPIQLVFLLINKLRYYEGIESEEDVLQIIESDTELSGIVEELESYSCGCENEYSDLQWNFPVICTLLFPIWTVVFLLTLFFGYPFGEFMMYIGVSLNCYWAWN